MLITFLLDESVPPTAVQRLVGHDDVQTTLAYYYHPSEAAFTDAAQRAATLLAPPSTRDQPDAT